MSSTTGLEAPAQAPALSSALAALVLALLLGLQPITTDLYLPALPLLAHDLHATMPAVQMTMAALLLCFGIGQLIWGPVADRIGRRPVLLCGLTLYSLASVGATLAGSIGEVVFWRAVQGAGMAAAVVCARAMLRDLYEPHQGAHVMSRALSGLGVIAILAPALGGLLSAAFGWRATLAAVAIAGIATLAFIGWRLPETMRSRNPAATQLAPLLAQTARTLRHRGFQAWAALVACSYGALFVFLAGASFVFIDVLGLDALQTGLAMATNSSAYVAGTFWCRRLLPRFGLAGSVVRSAGLTLLAGVLMAALAWLDVRSIWAILIPQWIFAFSHGVNQPCGHAGAVGPFPQAAGLASALAGFILAAVAFGTGVWLGQAMDGTQRPLAYGIAFWSLLTAVVAWTLVRRDGEPHAAVQP